MPIKMFPRKLHTLILVIALAAGLASAIGAPPHVAAESRSSYRQDELVVRLASSTADIDALSRRLGATTVKRLESDPYAYLLRLPPGADSFTVSQSLEIDPTVDFVEPNYIGSAPGANPRGIGAWGGIDPTPLLVQPALDQVHLSEAQAYSRGAGVTVAIIDTGVQLDHPALAASFTPDGYDFVDDDSTPTDTPDGIDNDGDGVIDEAYGHGTHIAGIVHTLAPDARLLALRVLTAEGDGDMFDLVRAIDYAVAHGASVINLSLGAADESQLLESAVRRATRSGAVVIAAAGNSGIDQPQYPAAGNCAFAVTSVGASGARSDFASYGSWVSLSAPGERIFSTFPTSGYATWSGTSMATAFVSGQAALLMSMRPRLDARGVASLIGGTASPLAVANPDQADLLGDGVINLSASLQAASTGRDTRALHSHITRSCVQQSD